MTVDVTTGSAFHWSRWLGAFQHLYVHLPRRNRTQRCSSCVSGVTTRAECHPTQAPVTIRRSTCRYIGHIDARQRRHRGEPDDVPAADRQSGRAKPWHLCSRNSALRCPEAERSGTATREPVDRAVSTDVSGPLILEPAEIGASRVLGADVSVETAPEDASWVRVPDTSASLHVQQFTGAGDWVRFGTCGCIHHAGSAPSRAARAYEVHVQVRNATQHGLPAKIRHSRCTNRETQRPSARAVDRWSGHRPREATASINSRVPKG